jgi:hypothetical protein
MYLLEFFSRKDGVTLQDFHATATASLRELEREFHPDRLEVVMGRSFRMGPHPGYISIWWIEGIDRLPQRRQRLTDPAAQDALQRFQSVATVNFAGVYDDMGEAGI